MNADLFYEVDDNHAIPLYLVSQTQWEEVREHCAPIEHNYFALRQFKGSLGDSCFIYNADGMIEKVYIGCGAGQREVAVAQAALQLPASCYQIQEPIPQQVALSWALAQYRFLDYKKQNLVHRKLVIDEADIKDVKALADAIFLVRDLINKPAFVPIHSSYF